MKKRKNNVDMNFCWNIEKNMIRIFYVNKWNKSALQIFRKITQRIVTFRKYFFLQLSIFFTVNNLPEIIYNSSDKANRANKLFALVLTFSTINFFLLVTLVVDEVNFLLTGCKKVVRIGINFILFLLSEKMINLLDQVIQRLALFQGF